MPVVCLSAFVSRLVFYVLCTRVPVIGNSAVKSVIVLFVVAGNIVFVRCYPLHYCRGECNVSDVILCSD